MNEPIKILLLDSFPEDTKLVESELEKGKIIAETLVVDNKTAFIKALTEFNPDIILSDQSLPDFNSIEALKLIKESCLDIPFILTTSTITVEFAVQALREGADDCILKSDLTRLPSVMVEILNKRTARNIEKKARQGIDDSHERLLFQIENSPLGYIEWDSAGLTVKIMSKRAEEIFGFTEREFKDSGRTGYIQVYEEDLLYAEKIAKELISGKVTNNTAQHRNYKKDGSVIWCEWFNSVLKDKEGKVIAIMSLVQDITERKMNEDELYRSEERYRTIVETAQEGIWTIDENDKTNFVNDKICRILEYSQEEMIGKKLFDFMDEEGREKALALIESQKKEPGDSYEFNYLTKTGKKICANISTNAIFGNDNKYLGALAMVTDITERKSSDQETLRLVESLQSKNKELRQFAYMVSHNLRAPIAKIHGLTLLYEKETGTGTDNTYLLENIKNEAMNLDDVVKDMNTIITARDSERIAKEKILFESKVKQIKLVLENEISQSKAVITTDFSKAANINSVKSYIYSILFNLISNAIKYRRDNVPLEIHIKTELHGDFICLSVSDNGSGIDLKKHGDKLFGMYKRFHGAEIPGRGIGLSLVKTQTESLGGRIEVISAVNNGTEFKIFLPKI